MIDFSFDPTSTPMNLREALLSGDLSRVDIRAEIELLRRIVADCAALGRDLVPLFEALAEQDALALVDLATGPKAPGSATLVKAAMAVAPALERNVAPASLYRRLVALHPPLAPALVRLAASRHPAANWMIAFSEKAGGVPGFVHLEAAADHPSFAQVCFAHAAVGHVDALERVALAARRPEPLSALLAAGHPDAAVRTVVGLLESGFSGGLAPWVVGVWGPEPDGFFVRVVPLLRSREAGQSLAREAEHWPRTLSFLRVTLPGLPPAAR
jgi:hypothetical protein